MRKAVTDLAVERNVVWVWAAVVWGGSFVCLVAAKETIEKVLEDESVLC